MTTPWSSETSWTVSRGSLDSVVTFESFDFPIDSESSCRKPPLLLLPPSSSDSEPCEIKLNFTQKHEIRQVYVRSTARIYEIYYSPALQSDNEYLCTVRCSAASVEENPFPATDVNEAVSANSGHSDILPKARVAGENKIGANEDDWVEVKLPVGPDQTSNNSRNYQDFYEATAEINDSEPCMSLTLRLLSLQTKGCVYVDEVYVFADPIDSNESENQTVNAETSAGGSLMTMLVPTLLGLTKSRSVQLPGQNSFNPVGKPIKTELEPTPVHQQDETLQNPSEPKAELTQSRAELAQQDETLFQSKAELTQLHGQNSSNPVGKPIKTELEPILVNQQDETLGKPSDPKAKLTQSRAEVLLEQLVARVSRIEDICMRFEENMLKPLKNMEARLQHVEQQVELLGRCPVSPEPRSISNDGHDSELGGEPELDKTGSFSTETHKPPEDTSCDETVEVNDVLESPKREEPKKTVSIDDALAAALARFSSFTKPNHGFTVESIDTTSGSNTDGEETASISSKSLKEIAPEFLEENDEATEIPDNNFDSQGSSQLDDEEPVGPTTSFSCPSSPPGAVKVLTFDKIDILKHFPDQPPDAGSESRVDFDSPILEVKFASFENDSLKSTLEALLTDSDDTARPATDEGMLVEERIETANDFLVDLGGAGVGEEVQQDLPPVQLETSFASLI